jgi:hypothetical protein
VKQERLKNCQVQYLYRQLLCGIQLFVELCAAVALFNKKFECLRLRESSGSFGVN